MAFQLLSAVNVIFLIVLYYVLQYSFSFSVYIYLIRMPFCPLLLTTSVVRDCERSAVGVSVCFCVCTITFEQYDSLWPPYVIGGPLYFCPVVSFCLLLLLLSFFISSPILSGRRLDVYHTLAHGVALVRM